MSDEARVTEMASMADQPPRFDQRIDVSQTSGVGGFNGVFLASLIGSLPGWAVMVASHGQGDPSWWRTIATTVGFSGGIALALIGAVVGMFAFFMLEVLWMKWRGTSPFSGNTRVCIDEDGLLVEGLGMSTWGEVLSWEGIPDSSNALVVHTLHFGALLLSTPTAPLVDALAHHHAAARSEAARRASDVFGKPDFTFTALVFHWPRFRAWIWFGYVLTGALAVALLSSASEFGVFKSLVACVVVCPLIAWLIWRIPLSRFSVRAGSSTRAFRFKGHQFEMGGGWCVDLSTCRVVLQSRSGLGYDLCFVTIAPRGARRLDLIIDEPERATVIKQMKAIGVQVEEHPPAGDLERQVHHSRQRSPIDRR